MLSDITFEQIRDNYWYGVYGEFRVVMDKNTGFINASKMCKDGGKNVYDWSRLKSTHEVILALDDMLGLENRHGSSQNLDLTLQYYPTENSRLGNFTIKKIKTCKKTEIDRIIAGIYIHPDLIPDVAGWISTIFRIKAHRVTNGYLVWQYKTQLANANQEKAKANQELDGMKIEVEQVNELWNAEQVQRHAAEALLEIKQFAFEAAQAQRLAIEEELEDKTILVDIIQQGAMEMRTQKQYLEGATKDITVDNNMLVDTIEQREGFIGKQAETIAEEKRRLRTYANDHAFAMYRILTDDGIPTKQYYSTAGKRDYILKALRKLKLKHQNIKVIFCKAHVANPINLRNRLKVAGIGHSKGNYFTSMVGLDKLITKLGELYTIVKPEQSICVRH
jgi:KilA-N domain